MGSGDSQGNPRPLSHPFSSCEKIVGLGTLHFVFYTSIKFETQKGCIPGEQTQYVRENGWGGGRLKIRHVSIWRRRRWRRKTSLRAFFLLFQVSLSFPGIRNTVDVCHQQLFGGSNVPSSQGPKGDFGHVRIRFFFFFLQNGRIFVQCLSARREAATADFGKRSQQFINQTYMNRTTSFLTAPPPTPTPPESLLYNLFTGAECYVNKSRGLMESGCARSLNVICFFWPHHERESHSALCYIYTIPSLLILSRVLCQAA